MILAAYFSRNGESINFYGRSRDTKDHSPAFFGDVKEIVVAFAELVRQKYGLTPKDSHAHSHNKYIVTLNKNGQKYLQIFLNQHDPEYTRVGGGVFKYFPTVNLSLKSYNTEKGENRAKLEALGMINFFIEKRYGIKVNKMLQGHIIHSILYHLEND